MGIPLPKEQFLERAMAKHSDKYDYSKINYVNLEVKICIVCKVHGEFWQKPSDHFRGGCRKCGNILSAQAKEIPFQEFVNKANIIHKNNYSYFEEEYTRLTNKTQILCSLHGLFPQSPQEHLVGHGCPICGRKKSGDSKRKSIQEFIEEANIKHNNFYDYTKSIYISYYKKLEIICPLHGSFWQGPSNHLHNCGCPDCGINKIVLSKISNTQDFIKKAIRVHGDKFNYDNVEYIGVTISVKINCLIHGEFLQSPNNHLSRQQGCPNCILTYGENKIKTYLENCKIPFQQQKTFKNCRNIKPLKYDFAIFNNGKYLLIEYQGRQHYKPSCFGGIDQKAALVNLEQSQFRDKIKRDWCADLSNNATLLEIPHWEFDNIENILLQFLQSNEIETNNTVCKS